MNDELRMIEEKLRAKAKAEIDGELAGIMGVICREFGADIKALSGRENYQMARQALTHLVILALGAGELQWNDIFSVEKCRGVYDNTVRDRASRMADALVVAAGEQAKNLITVRGVRVEDKRGEGE